MVIQELAIPLAASLIGNGVQTVLLSWRERRHHDQNLDLLKKIEENTRKIYNKPQ